MRHGTAHPCKLTWCGAQLQAQDAKFHVAITFLRASLCTSSSSSSFTSSHFIEGVVLSHFSQLCWSRSNCYFIRLSSWQFSLLYLSHRTLSTFSHVSILFYQRRRTIMTSEPISQASTPPQTVAPATDISDSRELTITFGSLDTFVAIMGVAVALLQVRHMRRRKFREAFELA
jgi:hypothetical protein